MSTTGILDLRRFYVTPLMTVDVDNGREYTFAEADALFSAGEPIVVRSADNAKMILIRLGLTPSDADRRITFGQTGHF